MKLKILKKNKQKHFYLKQFVSTKNTYKKTKEINKIKKY